MQIHITKMRFARPNINCLFLFVCVATAQTHKFCSIQSKFWMFRSIQKKRERTEVGFNLTSIERVFDWYCWEHSNLLAMEKRLVAVHCLLLGVFSRPIVKAATFSLFPFIFRSTPKRFIDLGMCKRIHITESTDHTPFCDAWAAARSVAFTTPETFAIRTSEFGWLWNLQFVE